MYLIKPQRIVLKVDNNERQQNTRSFVFKKTNRQNLRVRKRYLALSVGIRYPSLRDSNAYLVLPFVECTDSIEIANS